MAKRLSWQYAVDGENHCLTDCSSHPDEEARWIFLICGDSVTGARSRTVDDKYWQIRGKAGEMTPKHGLLHSSQYS